MTSSPQWRTALADLDDLEILVLEIALERFTDQRTSKPLPWVVASAMLGDIRAEKRVRAEMEAFGDEIRPPAT